MPVFAIEFSSACNTINNYPPAAVRCEIDEVAQAARNHLRHVIFNANQAHGMGDYFIEDPCALVTEISGIATKVVL